MDARAEREFSKALYAMRSFLVSFARGRMGCSKEDAEDFCQDAFASAWESRDRFDGQNLKAWLFTILRNAILSAKRRAWRKQPWNDAFDTTLAAADNPYFAILLRQTVSAMATLPVDYRDAIVRSVRGYSLEQSSEAFGVPIGTMKSRTARARHELRELVA